MATPYRLADLVPGVEFQQQSDKTVRLVSGHPVYVYQRNTTTPVTVYADSTLTTTLTQPLTTGAGGAAPGALPGWIAADQAYGGVDFFDTVAQVTARAEPMAVADIVGSDGKLGGLGSLGLSTAAVQGIPVTSGQLPSSVVSDASSSPVGIDSTGIAAGQSLAYDKASGRLKPTSYGNSLVQLLLGPSASYAPLMIAVQGNYIYWADQSTNNIGRCNLDGSSPVLPFVTTGAGTIWGIAVDSNFIYWTDQANARVGRSNLDGTAPNSTFITGLLAAANGYNLAVNASNIFVSATKGSSSTIAAYTLAGALVNATLVSGFSIGARQLVVDAAGQNLYWSEDAGASTLIWSGGSSTRSAHPTNGGQIGHATLSGSGAAVSASGINHSYIDPQVTDGPTGIAVDGTYVYWLDYGFLGLLTGNSYRPRIGRALLNGNNVEPNFIVFANSGPNGGAWDLKLVGSDAYATVWMPGSSGAEQLSIAHVNIAVAGTTNGGLATHRDVGAMITAALVPYTPQEAAGANFRPPLVPQFSTTAIAIAANTVYMAPISVPWLTKITGLWTRFTTASGNAIVGLYDALGNRVAQSASTAVSAAMQVPFTSPATILPGLYFVALIVDNATATIVSDWIDAAGYGTANGVLQGGFALPATITPPSAQAQRVPSFTTY